MFVVYTKDNCGYCLKAIALLELKKETFVKEKLDTEEKIQHFVSLGYKTVPQIFREGERIGGYDDLVKWYEAQNSAFDDE